MRTSEQGPKHKAQHAQPGRVANFSDELCCGSRHFHEYVQGTCSGLNVNFDKNIFHILLKAFPEVKPRGKLGGAGHLNQYDQ